MSALIRKSTNRLYRLFKIYLSVGILGALAVIGLELINSEPVLAIMVIHGVELLLISTVLLTEKLLNPVNIGVDAPPTFPKWFMLLMLPSHRSEAIISDLNEEFHHLAVKFGRRSAAIWYSIESMLLVCRLSTIHMSFGKAKQVVEEPRK